MKTVLKDELFGVQVKKMVWSLNAKLAVFSGMQSTERRGGLQWKRNLLEFII